MRYKADITAGSLKVAESRVIADLLLHGVNGKGWDAAIFDENVLKTRTPATAKRLVRLIRGRLEGMDGELWKLVRDGAGDVTTHACLASAVKHSHLLGDFLDLVVRDEYRVFGSSLSNQSFEGYLDDCRARDPEMPEWNESTRNKLRTTVFHILAQAGYIENTRTRKLQTVRIASPVLDYLQRHGEHYVFRCIQVEP